MGLREHPIGSMIPSGPAATGKRTRTACPRCSASASCRRLDRARSSGRLLPRLSRSCNGAIASAAGDDHARPHQRGCRLAPVARWSLQVTPHVLPLGFRQFLEPAASRVIVVGAGVHHRVGDVVVGRYGLSGWPSKANWRTFVPGMRNWSRSAQTSGVINPRSSAMNGRPPSSRWTAVKNSAPGPGTHWPDWAVAAPAGTCQAAAKPRK